MRGRLRKVNMQNLVIRLEEKDPHGKDNKRKMYAEGIVEWPEKQ